MRALARLCLAVPILVACSPRAETPIVDSAATATAPTVDPATVRQTIEQANSRFLEAIKAADTTAMLANYADDAVVMMPNEKAVAGRAAVAQMMSGMISTFTIKDPTFRTEDVLVSGDLAVEHGTYEWSIGPRGGAMTKDTGKYLTVWKRQADGSWKIVRDINNSSMPLKQ